MLSDLRREHINAHLSDVKRTIKLPCDGAMAPAEIGVAIVRSSSQGLSEDDALAAAASLIDHWGIGSKACNNGIALVLSVEDRKVAIKTGPGAKSRLTDVYVDQIIDSMKPALRQNDYAGAITMAVDQMHGELRRPSWRPTLRGGCRGRRPCEVIKGSLLVGLVAFCWYNKIGSHLLAIGGASEAAQRRRNGDSTRPSMPPQPPTANTPPCPPPPIPPVPPPSAPPNGGPTNVNINTHSHGHSPHEPRGSYYKGHTSLPQHMHVPHFWSPHVHSPHQHYPHRMHSHNPHGHNPHSHHPHSHSPTSSFGGGSSGGSRGGGGASSW